MLSFLKNFVGDSYENLWKGFIRPPRSVYEVSMLGPEEFRLGHLVCTRKDIEITNDRGLVMKCSHFEPKEPYRVAAQLPCVIYLHCNCGSRCESLNAVPILLPNNITFFCFDSSGYGQSDGEYISLGWFEREDLACVVAHLRASGRTSYIGLWGRSAGAATALLYGSRDPSIAGMVLDSPYASIIVLAEEIAKEYLDAPKFMIPIAMRLIRQTVQSKAHFDLYDLMPIDHVGQCFIPALFVAGRGDTFVLSTHTEQLYERYAGEKNLVMHDIDHNDPRPPYVLDSIGIFFYNTLLCEKLPERQVKAEGLELQLPKFPYGKAVEDEESQDGQDMPSDSVL